MPYLEMLVRPGMTVIFLFPYPVASRSYLLDHWVTTESTRDALIVGRSIMERYSQVAQKELARKLIAPTLTALQDHGVQVEIHLHSGSLAKAINSYGIDQDIHWVMTQFPPRSGWRGYWSAKKAAPLGGSTYLLSVRGDRSFSETGGRTIERTGALG